jgi:eukaryotic-like serine/threonine-protein kinase
MSKTNTNNFEQDELEAIVEAFEIELDRAGEANIGDFLPDSSEAGYLEAAVELIRVDLECARSRGIEKRLEAYRSVVPDVFEDPDALRQIAFEEYRLRRQEGERVDVAEYSRRFSIDTRAWPAWQGDTHGGSLTPDSLLRGNRAGDRGLQFPKLGEHFAGFEIIEALGRGAFGVVFRARQRDLARREVVLKITPARSVEPQRLARLQHTNIVPIYSVHQEHGMLGICMPFLGRHTLADAMRERSLVESQAALSTVAGRTSETIQGTAPAIGDLSVSDTARNQNVAAHDLAPLGIAAATDVVLQLAEGLAHAHARGIVHSDLKPANVLLADDGTPLLMDFNLAGDSAAVDYETLVVGGTLAYMSPEHLQATLDGKQTPAASDIYSLGVVFYELLARRRPFPHRDGAFEQCAASMIEDRRRGAPSVRALNPGTSPALGAIVAKCLAPDIQHRYREASELAEDLRRHRSNLPLQFAAEPSYLERGRKWVTRNARAVRVAALVALVAALVAALGLYAQRRERLLQYEANAEFADFGRDFVSANLSLNTPGGEADLRRVGRDDAQRALDRFGFDADGSRSRNNVLWRRLSADQQNAVEERAIKLEYGLADSEGEKQRLFAQSDASSGLGAYLHGIDLYQKREPAAAMKVFEGLRQRDPQDATLWLLLGNSYYLGHRVADAEACYTAVIALEPKGYTGYFYRGECRMDQQHFAEAAMDFDAVLALEPGLPSGLMNRALVWRALGALDRAEQDATKAIEGGLNDPRALFVRALIREARGNPAGAKADRARGFEMQPIDCQGWSARGIARLKDDPEKARDDFEAGLRAYPDTPALLENLIHVYGDVLHQQEQALVKADRLVELCPDEPSAWSTRAVLRARLGDREGARQDLLHVASNKVAPLTLLQLACAYSQLSPQEPTAADEAIQHLRTALAGDPRLTARASTDSDFDPIRARSDFAALVTASNQLISSGAPGLAQAPADDLPSHDADGRN